MITRLFGEREPALPPVPPTQFRVLYREFLFRTVDLEVLSAQGDPIKLLGQFAMLLTLFSLWAATTALFPPARERAALLIRVWPSEHFLIATTMFVVGLFAVLSWDSTFPDRRDVLVLAPLPVPARTIFLAKLAALGTALSVAVLVLNGFSGISWPLVALNPLDGSPLELVLSLARYRSLFAWWTVMFAAGAFVYCVMLSVQGIASLLPRRLFLRLSAVLQMAAFCLVVSVYFLEPSLSTPESLVAPANQQALAWLPSYWFLGLLQRLNGSMHPALAPLASRAFTGLALAVTGAALAFLSSYFRNMRKMVEVPDIPPGHRGSAFSLRLGNSVQSAILLFSLRTLVRSRQHRVILAFYVGVGFALVLAVARALLARLHEVNTPALFASVVMMFLVVVGTRTVFSMPLSLKANWVFQMTNVRGVAEYLKAARRSLLFLAVAPVWLACAAFFLWTWPWRPAAAHLLTLALLGFVLADLCLHGFQKIPFTCSYLPGKANVYRAFFLSYLLEVLIFHAVDFEHRALSQPRTFAWIVAGLVLAAAFARWRTMALAKTAHAVVQFEDIPQSQVFVIGLYRDGVLPITLESEPLQASPR